MARVMNIQMARFKCGHPNCTVNTVKFFSMNTLSEHIAYHVKDDTGSVDHFDYLCSCGALFLTKSFALDHSVNRGPGHNLLRPNDVIGIVPQAQFQQIKQSTDLFLMTYLPAYVLFSHYENKEIAIRGAPLPNNANVVNDPSIGRRSQSFSGGPRTPSEDFDNVPSSGSRAEYRTTHGDLTINMLSKKPILPNSNPLSEQELVQRNTQLNKTRSRSFGPGGVTNRTAGLILDNAGARTPSAARGGSSSYYPKSPGYMLSVTPRYEPNFPEDNIPSYNATPAISPTPFGGLFANKASTPNSYTGLQASIGRNGMANGLSQNRDDDDIEIISGPNLSRNVPPPPPPKRNSNNSSHQVGSLTIQHNPLHNGPRAESTPYGAKPGYPPLSPASYGWGAPVLPLNKGAAGSPGDKRRRSPNRLSRSASPPSTRKKSRSHNRSRDRSRSRSPSESPVRRKSSKNKRRRSYSNSGSESDTRSRGRRSSRRSPSRSRSPKPRKRVRSRSDSRSPPRYNGQRAPARNMLSPNLYQRSPPRGDWQPRGRGRGGGDWQPRGGGEWRGGRGGGDWQPRGGRGRGGGDWQPRGGGRGRGDWQPRGGRGRGGFNSGGGFNSRGDGDNDQQQNDQPKDRSGSPPAGGRAERAASYEKSDRGSDSD